MHLAQNFEVVGPLSISSRDLEESRKYQYLRHFRSFKALLGMIEVPPNSDSRDSDPPTFLWFNSQAAIVRFAL